MAGTISAAIVMVCYQSVSVYVFLYLDSCHTTEIAVRYVNEFWMESFVSIGPGQCYGNGIFAKVVVGNYV